jgi:hypothetical protein
MVCNFNIRASASVIVILVLSSAAVSQARSRKFTGQIFAYSPWEHLLKVPSFTQNQEIVIFRLRNRPIFVKLVFVGFGQEQLDEKYIDGSVTIAVRGRRDVSCDENAPQFFASYEPLVTNDEAAKPNAIKDIPIKHKYKIASTFSKSNIPPIDHLDCYAVESPRQ